MGACRGGARNRSDGMRRQSVLGTLLVVGAQ